MPVGTGYRAKQTFLSLGDGFADPVDAARFPEKILRYRNDRAAETIGLAALTDGEWIDHFAGFSPLPGSLPHPLAQRYHGHQFRVYNPQIGDGRGFLFAQMEDAEGRLLDLGTKGSGTTPYSRSGDGRLTLKGGVREILATEMLEAIGVNTSKTFSIIETGESLMRNDEPSPTRSAVMVRLNHGHIRIGTFQRHAYFSDTDRLTALVRYCLTHYFGELADNTPADDALNLLGRVMRRVADQAAELMAAGFVHGVLNTDNINITGEIFDFGPWRFLPQMDLGFTAAYFDETGLYSFGRQAEALHWNIYQLGGALADIADEQELKTILSRFPDLYVNALREKLLNRLGIISKGDKDDDALLTLVNGFMLENRVPYEQFFFDWYGGIASGKRPESSPLASLYVSQPACELTAALRSYAPSAPEASEAAYFRNGRPCTMLIDEVETLWSHIAADDNWQPLSEKLKEISLMRAALVP